MSILTKKTDEEKAANEQRKLEAKAAKQAEQERQAQEAAWQAWWITPAGQARKSYERSDALLQVTMDVSEQEGDIALMMGATASINATDQDPTVQLNAICREGWELVNASFTFVQTKESNRENIIGERSTTAISGRTVGYYLFRRNEAAKVSA